MRTIFRVTILAVAAFVVSGCARNRSNTEATFSSPPAVSSNSTNASGMIVTPVHTPIGKVSSVNTNLRFVVLTFPLGRLPELNQRLAVYRAGLKVGELVVTGPSRDDSTVADIVTGEALVGDQVRSN